MSFGSVMEVKPIIDSDLYPNGLPVLVSGITLTITEVTVARDSLNNPAYLRVTGAGALDIRDMDSSFDHIAVGDGITIADVDAATSSLKVDIAKVESGTSFDNHIYGWDASTSSWVKVLATASGALDIRDMDGAFDNVAISDGVTVADVDAGTSSLKVDLAKSEIILGVNQTVPTSLRAGQKVVAAAATPEALPDTVCRKVTVQAKSGNSGSVYVGNASDQCVELTAGEGVDVEIDNLNKIYVRVAVDGEGVNYIGS